MACSEDYPHAGRFASLQADCTAALRALGSLALDREAQSRDRSMLEQSLHDKDKLIASLRHQLTISSERTATSLAEKGLQQKVSYSRGARHTEMYVMKNWLHFT